MSAYIYSLRLAKCVIIAPINHPCSLNYCKLLDVVRSSSTVSQEIIILADRKCCEHIRNNIVKIYARFGTRIPVEQQKIERTSQLRYELQIKMRFIDKFFNLKKTQYKYKYMYLYDIYIF